MPGNTDISFTAANMNDFSRLLVDFVIEKVVGTNAQLFVENSNCTAAIIKLLLPEKEQLHTITFDNGKEFAYHAQIKKALDADNYFAHPYHSWERGLNENHNGLIRQYLPKGMPLDKVTDEELILIQDKLNNRPRKLLGYKTPNEVYDAMCLVA